MTDYISREAAIGVLERSCGLLAVHGVKNADYILTRYGIDALRDRYHIPAADVRPVVRGKWEAGINLMGGIPIKYCSECSQPANRNAYGYVLTNFCPNCGADMREETEAGNG